MVAVLEERELFGYVEMTNEQYHDAPGTSKSHLDCIAERSDRHYWAEYVDPNRVRQPSTPALLLGNAIHRAILEPDLFETEFFMALDLPHRSNADKEAHAAYAAANAGKTLLTAQQYDACIKVRDEAHRHPVASGLLTGGVSEQSFFAPDPETGALIKCRLDYRIGDIDGGIVIDVKSTTDASPDAFGRDAAKFRYDLQPAWYFDVLHSAYRVRPSQFVWIAIEKEWPFAVGIYYADEEMIERARVTARRDFLRILECRQRGEYPDYGHTIQKLQLPNWVQR